MIIWLYVLDHVKYWSFYAIPFVLLVTLILNVCLNIIHH